MDNILVQSVLAILAVVSFSALYFWVSNALLTAIGGDRAIWPTYVRPWLFMGPALFFLGLFLIYPVFETLWLSFHERQPGRIFQFVGFQNYSEMFSQPKFGEALRNNFLWLLVVPALSTALGLVVAQLTDRLRWGELAKSLIFAPMAISLVGAGVIWKFVYEFRSEDAPQIGILNAIIVLFGGEPQTWLFVPFWNNFFLMIVLVWIQTGFAMVILSAALRGVPEDTIEAAIIDGANPWQVFFRVRLPQITSTVIVVWTTITITVLKIFDIVFAMTNGEGGTQVLANYMWNQFTRANDWGIASAAAIILMLMVLPIMIWNLFGNRR